MEAHMLAIPEPFGVWFSTRATLASSTSIDGREPSPGARLLYVVDALAVRRPGLTTLLQGRVVQFSTHIEGCLQFFSLPAIRVKAIFERSSGHRKLRAGQSLSPHPPFC